MTVSIYEFKDYKSYLNSIFSSAEFGRGVQAKLAQTLGCGTSFVSQVLRGSVHFNLEQGIKVSQFLGHTEDEQDYFLFLVQLERAGSVLLRDYLLKKLQEIREKRLVIQERLGVKKSLNKEAQLVYYSSWIYSAIHILLSASQFHTKQAIADHLGLPSALVGEVLDFLVTNSLAIFEKGRYKIGTARIHLGVKSPMLSKHHWNWRVRAIRATEMAVPEHMHFTSVVGLGKEDAAEIKKILLNAIEKAEKVVQGAKEEGAYCLGIDFYDVAR